MNFSYRFQNFVSGLSCVQNRYAQLHHFFFFGGGVKAAALTFPSTLQTVANVNHDKLIKIYHYLVLGFLKIHLFINI